MSETYQAPDFFDTREAVEQRDTHTRAQDSMTRLQEAAREGRIVRDPDAPRMFVSPTHPNDRFLIKAGKNITAPIQQGMMGLVPIVARDGDLWVEFNSGVCIADSPEATEWLEAHTGDPTAHATYHMDCGENPRNCSAPVGLCQEQGPGIDDWYKMKQAQMPLANRPIALDPDIDVDFYIQAAKGNAIAKRSSAQADKGISNVVAANENALAERAQGV